MRSHVFPVCNPNILEFKRENTLGWLSGGIGRRLFHTDGSWGQLLFSEANMEDWVVDGQTEERGYFSLGWIPPEDFFAPIVGYTSEPPNGLVICIGSKNKENGTFDPHYTYSRCLPNPNLLSLFSTTGLGFRLIYDDQQDAEEYHGKPKFFTIMWTGTRWVLLGSNNWY